MYRNLDLFPAHAAVKGTSLLLFSAEKAAAEMKSLMVEVLEMAI